MRLIGTIVKASPDRTHGYIEHQGIAYRFQFTPSQSLMPGDRVSFEVKRTSENGLTAVRLELAGKDC